MTNVEKGDTVRCIKTWTTYSVETGDVFEVEEVIPPPGTPLIRVDGQWVPSEFFEKIGSGWQTDIEERTVGIERRTVGTDRWNPTVVAYKGEAGLERARKRLDLLAASKVKGPQQEYRIVEVEHIERYRVLSETITTISEKTS
jgi:hypothetical protein